jgi:hypothetical protein
MTALAQGSAGLALVMSFALLVSGQVTAAAIMLVVQSAAVAVTAVVLHQPLMAIPPLVLAAGTGLPRRDTSDPHTTPVGGAKLGIAVGAVLAILCQSLGILALPASIVLLSILLAATRSQPLMHIMALVALQNGVILAGSLIAPPATDLAALLFPLACLALPLPIAATLLTPVIESWRDRGLPRLAHGAAWFGWIDLGLALAMVAATLVVPLAPLASVFAPLLALDGVARSSVRRNRPALTVPRRTAALAQTGFTVLAVCAPDLTTAWLAVLAALAMALLPAMSRRWNGAVLACLAAGLALFGVQLLSAEPPVLGWFSLFAGFVTIAAIVPDLAVVFVVLLLRLATRAAWPPDIQALGVGIAVIALLACAILLTNPARSHRASLLFLGQASIALLAICIGQADGRFGALILLILLILSRAAARIAEGPVAALAMAGLGGVPPVGVFPGLALVVLALSAHYPWLLLPLGAALVPMMLASVPRRLPDLLFRLEIPSIAWLPLALAILVGYFTPDTVVHWLRLLVASPP